MSDEELEEKTETKVPGADELAQRQALEKKLEVRDDGIELSLSPLAPHESDPNKVTKNSRNLRSTFKSEGQVLHHKITNIQPSPMVNMKGRDPLKQSMRQYSNLSFLSKILLVFGIAVVGLSYFAFDRSSVSTAIEDPSFAAVCQYRQQKDLQLSDTNKTYNIFVAGQRFRIETADGIYPIVLFDGKILFTFSAPGQLASKSTPTQFQLRDYRFWRSRILTAGEHQETFAGRTVHKLSASAKQGTKLINREEWRDTNTRVLLKHSTSVDHGIPGVEVTSYECPQIIFRSLPDAYFDPSRAK